MRALRPLLLLFLLVYGLPAQAQPAPPGSPRSLARALDEVLDDAAFENGFWGVVVVDLETGERLYDRYAGKSFMPASNTKLYTTAAALDQLGPTYRYRTRLYAQGAVVDSVLMGNLIVRGAADPTLGGHYDAETGKYEERIDATRVFRAWADSLRAAGIAAIAGDLIGDDDIVDDTPLGYGWSWDDETYYYSAQLSGLSFNDNVIHMQVAGRREGQPATIDWQPFRTSYVEVVNQTRTTAPGTGIKEGYERQRGTNRLLISTQVPAGQVESEELTVENPTLFTVHVLREALLHAGLPVGGRAVDVDDLSIKPDYAGDALRQVASHTSLPLSAIALMINKPSQNLYADLVLKTLGVERPVGPEEQERKNLTPGSSRMGVAAASRTFARAGVDTSRIQLVDGSGLSRLNLITPEMTLALLRYMWNHPDPAVKEAFYQSLPVAGVDGTLRNRLKQGPAFRNVRAKTGSLGNVSTLSGYVQSGGGTPLAFVVMANHYTVPTRKVREAQDALLTLLARYRR